MTHPDSSPAGGSDHDGGSRASSGAGSDHGYPAGLPGNHGRARAGSRSGGAPGRCDGARGGEAECRRAFERSVQAER